LSRYSERLFKHRTSRRCGAAGSTSSFLRGVCLEFRDGRCIFRIKYWRLIGSSCPLLATLLSRSSAARRDDTLVSHTSPLHACERLSMKRHIAVLLAGLLVS